jgi:hypothetical protein
MYTVDTTGATVLDVGKSVPLKAQFLIRKKRKVFGGYAGYSYSMTANWNR